MPIIDQTDFIDTEENMDNIEDLNRQADGILEKELMQKIIEIDEEK